MIAYTYPLLNLFWSLLIFFGFVMWIWLLVTVFVDLFRSPEMGGWAKAGWFLFVLVLPLVGVLIYLIAHGRTMAEHAAHHAAEQEQAFSTYVRQVAGDGASTTDQLVRLADLRDRGALSAEEFEQQKAKILAA